MQHHSPRPTASDGGPGSPLLRCSASSTVLESSSANGASDGVKAELSASAFGPATLGDGKTDGPRPTPTPPRDAIYATAAGTATPRPCSRNWAATTSIEHGLATNASTPASSAALRSSGVAFPVIATIRGCPPAMLDARIRRVASKPSITGMLMSMNTNAYRTSPPATAVTACSPSNATSTRAPDPSCRCTCRCSRRAFTVWSSTTSTPPSMQWLDRRG
mmetsp:Transcript_28404/g.92035  ORF Transcript_28404/g.92035 Transcript_28404/m.92035 type:complete len:219 (+) Transcript_28404:869-1525(+)